MQYFTTISNAPHLGVDETVLKSEEAMWAFYEYWCKYHGVKRDRYEMERRFETFSATARFVHKAQNSNTGVKYAMTKYADISPKEMLPGIYRRS